MNRDDFSSKLATRANLTEVRAREIANLIFDGEDGIIARELHKVGGTVIFAGFGRFETRVLQARVSRNPKTGEEFDSPAKRVVRFKPGQNIKTKIASKLPAGSVPPAEE